MYKKVIVVILALAFVLSTTTVATAAELKDRLKGYILLQVEANGEAWYVNPNDGYRYYMKDGTVAYQMMREFGLGITNANLKKIPVGIDFRFNDSNPQTDQDGDGLSDKLEEALGTPVNNNNADQDEHDDGREVLHGYDPFSKSTTKLPVDSALVNQLRGKILIQVEGKGEAWYVNPVDGKRYFLGSPELAYQVMRYLSLGVTNKDLMTITQNIVSPLGWKNYTDNNQGISFYYPNEYELGRAKGMGNNVGPDLGVWDKEAFNAPDCGQCFPLISITIDEVSASEVWADYIIKKYSLPVDARDSINNGGAWSSYYKFSYLTIAGRDFLKIDGGEYLMATTYLTRENNIIVSIADNHQDNDLMTRQIAETLYFSSN
jgi:hypothetical protein